jgi:hypothetical protein
VAEYGFTAHGKPGKYSIPVKIMFKKPDGTPTSLSKNLEYIIAE